MNDIELAEYRIQRLKQAVDKLDDGNKTAFGRRLGYKDGAFIRQLMAGTRPISEKTILQIESLHGMQGWFNIAGYDKLPSRTPTESRWPFTSISLDDVTKLPIEAKNRLEGALGLAIAQLGLNLPVAPSVPAVGVLSKANRLDSARALIASVQSGGDDAANDPGFVEIRRAAVRVSAGVRGFTADIVGSEFNGSIYLPRAVIEKHRYSVGALVATTVTGDSMAPRIGEHDVLLLNTADTDRKAGHVYGINHDGQFLVKRLAWRHKRWYLDSDNTAHHPVLAEENTFIVGRVVMMVSSEP